MRYISMLTLFVLTVARVEACSVVLYFPMMFEGAEGYAGRLSGGVIIAIAAAVLFKTMLLDKHLRTTAQYRDCSIVKTFPTTLSAVSVANVLSTIVGYYFAGSFISSHGFQIVIMPMLAMVTLSGVWFIALYSASATPVSKVPIKLQWLVGMALITLIATPHGLIATVIDFFTDFTGWGGGLALLSIIAFLNLLRLVYNSRSVMDTPPGALPTPSSAVPDTKMPLSESDQALFMNFVMGIMVAGFITAFVGGSLVNVDGIFMSSLSSSGSILFYWLIKIVVTTIIFGLGLFSTTAFEAIVLLPFYRFIFEPVRPVGEVRLDAYRNFFGDLFRINAVAVGIVLLLFAIGTLPVRLSTPGFLY